MGAPDAAHDGGGRVRVAAVVVNHDGAAHLEGCLASLRDQTQAPDEIVVVDNASGDRSLEVLEREAAADPGRTRILANRTNRGFAGGANDGIAASVAPAVVVANPDVRAAPGFLAAALEALEADRRCGAVQGKLHRMRPAPSGAPVIDTTGHRAFTTRLFRNRGEGEIDRGQFDRPGSVFGVSGALAVYRRAMLDDVALSAAGRIGEVFDEDLFAFFDDVDLDWRAALRGWRTAYQPAAVATHERGGAGPRRTPFVERLNWRNRLLVMVKNDDARAVATALPGILATTLLKSGELAVTAPAALLGGLADLSLIRTMLVKRRAIGARATVPRRRVVERWFEPFDYPAWIGTWWRRVRGIPPGG